MLARNYITLAFQSHHFLPRTVWNFFKNWTFRCALFVIKRESEVKAVNKPNRESVSVASHDALTEAIPI